MDKIPPTLDMRLDGSFRAPPRITPPISPKLVLGTALFAVAASAIAMTAFALWLLSMALPVLVLGGVGAWAWFRFQRWQATRHTMAVRRYD